MHSFRFDADVDSDDDGDGVGGGSGSDDAFFFFKLFFTTEENVYTSFVNGMRLFNIQRRYTPFTLSISI